MTTSYRTSSSARLALVAAPAHDPATQLTPVERLGNLLVASAEMRAVVTRVKRLARSSATVLISGPSGTGKELVARALHEESSRRAQPFLAINCGALSSTVIESELFGHVKGSFTGAVADKEGAFQAVDGGTLFLDEIAELPLELQPKLLRVLEAMCVRKVGGTCEEPVDVRIVAATHRDLRELVARGQFREDLFHRLFVLSVNLPALASRPADIMLLARHFLASEGDSRRRFESSAGRALLAHSWPGNVRELRNVVTRALVNSDKDSISADDLEFLDQVFPSRGPEPRKIATVTSLPMPNAPALQREEGQGASLREEMEALERERIRQALAAHPSQVEAARALGVPIRTFLNRLDALGIARPRKSR